MSTTSVEQEILEHIMHLSPNKKVQVLDFVRTLTRSAERGEAGRTLLEFVGCIPATDLKEMEQAIRDGCEEVDADGW